MLSKQRFSMSRGRFRGMRGDDVNTCGYVISETLESRERVSPWTEVDSGMPGR